MSNLGMDVLEAIASRRSVRKFSSRPVEREKIERALLAASQAPSAKNRQNWRFVVAQGESKAQMISAMGAGIEAFERGDGFFRPVGPLLADARFSMDVMDRAPAVIFVINTKGAPLDKALSPAERMADLLGVQSVSAAIENLLLAAHAQGLGTLWVGNVFFAYRELTSWLGLEAREQMMAAVVVGYPDEPPKSRPEKSLEKLVQWRE